MRFRKTKDAAYIEYITRQVKRFGILAIAVFILFVIIMAIIWAAPRVWNWALG
jgi:hypothetical protein